MVAHVTVTMGDPLFQAYQTYGHRVRRFLTFGGVRHCVGIHAGVSYGAAILTVTTCFFMACGVLNFCWYNLKNLNVLTKGLSFVCSLIATSLRALCFAANRKSLMELEQVIDKLFKNEIKYNGKPGSKLFSLLHTFDRPAYVYSFLVGGTVSMYYLPPLKSLIRHFKNPDEIIKYPLPFPAKFPWDVESRFFYQIHFVFETTVAWFLYFTNSGVDALFGFYVFHIASLLRSMTQRLKDPEANDRLLLRDCVNKHAMLLRCRDILERIYGPIILWLVLTNGIVMCALIFQAFQTTDMTAGKIVLFVLYMFLKIVQTFTYAWYGTILTSESEAFRQGFYYTNWPKNNTKELKSGIVIAMMQRPITIRALDFFYVSIDMFRKIMNTTMSYFFLLQTIDESG